MAKKKKKEDNFYEDLANETGGQVFHEAGKTKYLIDTGNLALNFICSGKFIPGGLPGGRIIEVSGPEASAKSLIGLCAMGATQRMDGIAVYEDCERAGNAEFSESCGRLDSKKLVTHYPATYEAVEKKITKTTLMIRKVKGPDVPILFVLDSIGVIMTEREWKEIDLPDNPTDAQIKAAGGKERPGERAKAASKFFRQMNPFLNENNATLYVINQLRSKIGVLYGDPNTGAGGGMALPYYASCRLRLASRKHIQEEGTDFPMGVNFSVKNVKNRSFRPFIKTDCIQLYFDGGVNPISGLLSIFVNAGRVKKNSNGNYQVNEPWAGGREIKFKGSAVRNDVPLSLLLECPAIVDAETEDEVKEYLSVFQKAIDISTGGKTVEISTNIEEEAQAIVKGK